MDLKEYEFLVIDQLCDEENFFDFIEKNIIKLDENLRGHLFSEEKKVVGNIEIGALEYLEEIAKISPELEENIKVKNITEDTEEEFITKKMYLPAKLALYLAKEGIGYVDLVQEGSFGLIHATKKFENSGYKNFDDYAKLFVARSMILHIYERLQESKSEFILFFQNKKEEYEEKEDLFLELDKKQKQVENIEYSFLKNILQQEEIELVIKYFGLGKKVRDLTLPKGEEFFQAIINKLSKVGGAIFTV
ncbi:MAG: hypothetical protein ACRCSK_08665 [Fusobacteriaceae bacterium]